MGSTAVCVMLVSVVSTAARSNAQRLTIPWTKRPVKSTASGKAGAPTRPTNSRLVSRQTNTRQVSSTSRVTPSSSANGTLMATPPKLSSTTQSRNSRATVLRLVITAVVVVSATLVMAFASASRVSQVPLVKRLLIPFNQ